MTFFEPPTQTPQRLPHRLHRAVHLQRIDPLQQGCVGVLLQMPEKLLFLFAGNSRFPAAAMHLRLECSQLAMLSHQLSHHRPAHRETLRQLSMTPFAILVRGHDPPSQIH
jgi:hypothetical protein